MPLLNLLVPVLKKRQDPEELFKTLEQYLKHAKMGQFAVRLEILGFLQKFYPRRRQLLQSLIDFYMNFWELYDAQLQLQKQEAQKDIRECELLVGWDSNNFHVIKATVEKFHTKLYKIGKKFKDYLDQSFQSVLFTILLTKGCLRLPEQIAVRLDRDSAEVLQV